MASKLLSCLSCWQMYSPAVLTKGTGRHSCATACLGMTAGTRLGWPFHQLTNGLLHYSQLFSLLCSLAYVFPLLLRATLHRRILPLENRDTPGPSDGISKRQRIFKICQAHHEVGGLFLPATVAKPPSYTILHTVLISTLTLASAGEDCSEEEDSFHPQGLGLHRLCRVTSRKPSRPGFLPRLLLPGQ